MKHAVAVEEVVGTIGGEELWVWAVSNVCAVEARREGAMDNLAFCRRKFVDGSEILGKDNFGVDGGFDWRVDVVVDDGVEGIEDQCRFRLMMLGSCTLLYHWF